MTIGINVTAAIKQPRTGVEEYVYQLIKHLTMLPESRQHRFFLYLPSVLHRMKTNTGAPMTFFDFPLPENFIIKESWWPMPFFWTQIRLAWEMKFCASDVAFFPVHILPFVHSKNSIVTIHGLEYEYFPEYYPLWQRLYFRINLKYALKHAQRIIAITENTKQDLIKLYGGDEKKIKVVHHGTEIQYSKLKIQSDILKFKIQKPYLLYLGRLEQKKNIEGILDAYKILKEKYNIPHKLILVGAPGYGYKKIKLKIRNFKLEIKELGYVDEPTKWQLLKNAEVFLFPSFYEGFGLPVLEAQAVGTPLVTSYNSCLPKIAGEGALFVDPKNPAQIAEAIKSIIDDKNLRDKLIQSGFENIKRFSWEECAKKTLEILVKK
jgi:glycosyltransferase involved in cell wall biosynthesis